jgi:hypothetical protein
MNKIVIKHYPASKLPDDLREGIAPWVSVKVTVEVETAARLSIEELVRRSRELQKSSPGTTIEEAVARIRALRDEWD